MTAKTPTKRWRNVDLYSGHYQPHPDDIATVNNWPSSPGAQRILDDADDCQPGDMDEFRFDFARLLQTYMGFHRRCGETACRRAMRCTGPERCNRDFPPPPISAAEWSEVIATIRKGIAAQCAELGIEE